ncbi:MAG: serine hydroxymethyltransferase [Thermoplasmata archaeon]|nr:MAG: serine hydroxymethyltransferase [Thermoplasmata archaeon]
MEDVPNFINEMVRQHHQLFENGLPMIASENVLSPAARKFMVCDFMDRYAEGLPGERYYQGNKYVDEVEIKCNELAKELFKVPYADVRPISGTNANQAVLFGMIKPTRTITVPDVSAGAHISSAEFGSVGFRGLRDYSYPWDLENMNIDVDESIKLIRNKRPELALFGMSVFLFPTPIKELMDALMEVEAIVWYDGAHVLGLIGGGQFQDPFREGVDIMTGSTHKTLPGPQRGIILCEPKSKGMKPEKMMRKLNFGVFPGVLSNHHLHTMAALAITLAEHLKFGEAYAKQVIKNAKALGQALHERGFKVLCEHLNFTESHTIAMDVKPLGGAAQLVIDLETAYIITNKNLLPWDHVDDALNPSGIRLGSQELTRLGMKESEMDEVAEFFKRICIDKEDPKKVGADVKDFKKNFNTVQYCFGAGTPAYKMFEVI